MSLFSKILDKLGLNKDKTAGNTAAPVAAPPKPTAGASIKVAPVAKPAASVKVAPAAKPVDKPAAKPTIKLAPAAASPKPAGQTSVPSTTAPGAPKAISEVDVTKKLEQLNKGKGLNWKVSIVDLLTLLGIDSSHEARNELAKELGCPPELMSDPAKMNTWLHKTVLKKIAENGGNIPKELLD